MDHLEEHVLDLYVLSPGKLSARTRERARSHLSQCPLCGENEKFLRSFYGDLKEAGSGVVGNIDELIERVLPRPPSLRS
jgi:hypothetical protein